MDNKNVEAKVVQLKTQLVKEGHTRHLLAETDLWALRRQVCASNLSMFCWGWAGCVFFTSVKPALSLLT
jgi:hypothetical protein